MQARVEISVNEDGQLVVSVKMPADAGLVMHPVVLPRKNSAAVARQILAAQEPTAAVVGGRTDAR